MRWDLWGAWLLRCRASACARSQCLLTWLAERVLVGKGQGPFKPHGCSWWWRLLRCRMPAGAQGTTLMCGVWGLRERVVPE